MDATIKRLVDEFQQGLTLNGRHKVLENGYELTSYDLVERSEPEAYTREFLINPILDELGLKKLSGKQFKDAKGSFRSVDYYLKNQRNGKFLAEAKPINADLFKKTEDGAINQIKGIFRLAEVKENYEFGIAVDGLKWIFIDNNSVIVYEYNVIDDFNKIKALLTGEDEVSTEHREEEISKKFYDWYIALLHGGKYSDHENKTKYISEKDSLIENIWFVAQPEDREYIAQTAMDRLIFVKFLQSKGIISNDILDYLLTLDEDVLNEKIKQLFFSVLNTKIEERIDIDPAFKEIPYLNGSLFVRTETELNNPDYKIAASILKEVIGFLDSFNFVHTEDISSEKTIDPEILGYIFERAMTATDRRGSGAYYTPKVITKYISQSTIHPVIIEKANKILKEKGYKDSELLSALDDVYKLRELTLGDIFEHIILNLKICDNACGSGAFLLAAADILLDIYKRINDELRLRNSEVALRKLILKNNLYGVDINPNAIEIAKLRLWLWLVTAYKPEKVEPLPNIDYNIRKGNSLVGYTDISQFKDRRLTLLDWSEESLQLQLVKREEKIVAYKDAVSGNARTLKLQIDETDEKIRKLLDLNLYQEINQKASIDEKEFQTLNPFHWGFEFYDVFEQGDAENNGFDIIIGNPPYVRVHKIADVDKRVLKALFYSPHRDFDIYVCFIERALHLVKKYGYIGLIVSDKFLIREYGKKVRRLILDSSELLEITDVSHIGVFKDASVYPIINMLRKVVEQTGTNVVRSSNPVRVKIVDNLSKISKKEDFALEQIQLYDSKDNVIEIKIEPEFLEIISHIQAKNPKLIELCQVSCSTPRSKDYYEWGNHITEGWEQQNSLRYLVCRNIEPYTVKWGVKINTVKQSFRHPYLNYASDLFSHEKWDGFEEKGKIIIRGNDTRLTAIYDFDGFSGIGLYFLSKCKLDSKILTVLINSNLLNFFYLKKFATAGISGKYISINGIYLDQLPIRIPADSELFIQISNLLLFLIQYNYDEYRSKKLPNQELQNQIQFFEKIANCLVYELYFEQKFLADKLNVCLSKLIKERIQPIEYDDWIRLHIVDEPQQEKTEKAKQLEMKNLAVIADIFSNISGSKDIKEQIEEILRHKWVTLIENSFSPQ